MVVIWMTRCGLHVSLLENPDVIVQVHADYFRAGADCAITSSYQASVEGFRKRGIEERPALDLIRKTVELVRPGER